MTSQQLKESLEEFDKKFGSLYSVKCEPDGRPITNDLKHFLTTHTIKLLQAEIERLEGKKLGGHRDEEQRIFAGGYDQALQDQISHLQEQIIKIKE